MDYGGAFHITTSCRAVGHGTATWYRVPSSKILTVGLLNVLVADEDFALMLAWSF